MNLRERNTKCTAANVHIATIAALPSFEKAVRNASLSPAGKYLEAATAPICHHDGCKSDRICRIYDDKLTQYNILD
jgi:hypothetical protein